MAKQTFDVIVIGAGPVGEVAAGRLADGGLDVAIVERELVGGECSFYACMPSKALLRPQELLAEAARVPGAAEAVAGRGVDVAAALARRDEIVHGLDDADQLPWLRSRDITLVLGAGRLDGERRVRVGDELLEARAITAVGGSFEHFEADRFRRVTAARVRSLRGGSACKLDRFSPAERTEREPLRWRREPW